MLLFVCPQIYFQSENVRACIVTCGGLCPGINTVIREIVCGLWNAYGVREIFGIDVSKNFFLRCNRLLQSSGCIFRLFEAFSYHLFRDDEEMKLSLCHPVTRIYKW